MRVIVYFSLLLTALMISGCTSVKHLNQGQEIERDYFSIIWNSATWDFTHSKEKYYVAMEKGNWADGEGNDSQKIYIIIYRQSYFKGKNYWTRFVDFSISSASYRGDERLGRHRKHALKAFFDKNGDFEALLSDPDIYYDSYMAYNKKWSNVTYVQGMKCLGDTFLQGQADQMKVYDVTCGYYDKNKGRRVLNINFGYRSKDLPSNNYNNSYSNWKEISNTGEIPHVQPVEDLTKQAAKQIISTLKIKNFDRVRMERDGLMHYDKIFELSKY